MYFFHTVSFWVHFRLRTRKQDLIDFIEESTSCTSSVQAALHCFPDICSTFPFCVAGRGSGMEKALPRLLRPHGKGGEQSVRSPPATVGHICGQLSPRCSLSRSAARPASALCCSLPALFLTISHMFKSKNWSQA